MSIRVWWGILAATLVAFSGAFVWDTLNRKQKAQELPVLGQVADFSLTDQTEQTITRKDLLGKPWIADFIYTTCPDQCPMMSRRMQVVQGLLPKKSGVKLVSISVDPKRDTPRALSQYAKKYHADGSRWRFLTGKAETIKTLASSFKVGISRQPTNNPVIDHSDQLILVDAEGRIRGYYGGTDEKAVQRLIKDVSEIASAEKVL